VETDAILCDHVQAAENKLFISGGGITRSFVSPTPPHMIMLGLAAVVRVPYTATNQAHTLTISLLDEDGKPVVPFVPEGAPDPGPVELQIPFNLGRPPGLSPGEAQVYPLAANFNMGLRQVGGYTFDIKVDGESVKELSLRVVAATPSIGMMRPGSPFGG
jgi:hypothetical protein